jgi:G3E family GTPase
MSAKNTPIPSLILLTGFLGSGKTTFLKELIRHPAMGNRNAIIVNDFGTEVYDRILLSTETVMLADVPGGCLCCSASEHFHEALHALLPHKPERIFIEATGLADPVQVRYDVAAMGIPVALTLCVVDAEHFLLEQRLTATAAHQVRTSNILLLAKTDRVSASTIEQTLTHLSTLNPMAPIIHLRTGRLPIESLPLLFAEDSMFQEHGDVLQEHLLNDNISAVRIRFSAPLSLPLLEDIFSALPATVLRCKGVMSIQIHHNDTHQHLLLIQYVCGSLTTYPIQQYSQEHISSTNLPDHTSSLFMIGHHLVPASLHAILAERLTAGGYTAEWSVHEGRVQSLGVRHHLLQPLEDSI